MKPKDKVKVYIFGNLTEIVIFSLDSKYIYFNDPNLKGSALENRLYSRHLDQNIDTILI